MTRPTVRKGVAVLSEVSRVVMHGRLTLQSNVLYICVGEVLGQTLVYDGQGFALLTCCLICKMLTNSRLSGLSETVNVCAPTPIKVVFMD